MIEMHDQLFCFNAIQYIYICVCLKFWIHQTCNFDNQPLLLAFQQLMPKNSALNHYASLPLSKKSLFCSQHHVAMHVFQASV